MCIRDSFTIASTGNGTDFGDLIDSQITHTGGTSNSIRGLWGGGFSPGNNNSIEYVTIATTGNAKDFGDILVVQRGIAATSDSHGGLS